MPKPFSSENGFFCLALLNKKAPASQRQVLKTFIAESGSFF